MCLSELSTLCCNVKTLLMLPQELKPDWYSTFSKPVFKTSIPMILKWEKNSKSTKASLLIDYLWEQRLKRKRTAEEIWIHINLKVFLCIMEMTRMNDDISKFFWTFPNHFQFCSCCTNILYNVHVCQIRLLC